ncbi:MAG: hypothetical protein WBM50_18340 [Acidimicrobiales bacterium]
MPIPPPPGPTTDGPIPPPGRAQRLVAGSGFVVYERGRSIFDESVLVYLARSGRDIGHFDVVDHVGRPLGASRPEERLQFFTPRRSTVLIDPGGSELLRVVAERGWMKYVFAVSGVANARFETASAGLSELRITSNGERFGGVIGRGIRGLAATDLAILDHNGIEVGRIRVHRRQIWSPARDYVVSTKPGRRDELRRLIPAVPVVLATLREFRRKRA